MKEKGVKKWYYRSMFSLCFTILFLVVAYAAYCENWPKIIILIMAILAGISVIGGFVFWIIWVKFSFKKDAEYAQKQKDLAKTEISSEFKKVVLNNISALQCEDFECETKYNQNGKILVKIHFDYEKEFDDAESFLNYFHFPNND